MIGENSRGLSVENEKVRLFSPFESAAEMSLVRTVIRATADGAVLDQDANPLASARSQDGQRLVYTDTALDILGFAERDTSNATTSWDRVSMWPSEVKEGSRPGLMGGSEDAREGRHGLVVVLVDGPVTDLQLTGVPDATNVRTESLALSQGKVALVATYGTTAGMGTFRPALTWTDAAGRAQSFVAAGFSHADQVDPLLLNRMPDTPDPSPSS